jgi:Tc toxin complex TcA C-terminal TcB-binding domain
MAAVCDPKSETVHIDGVQHLVALSVCIDSPKKDDPIAGSRPIPITVTGHGIATRVRPSSIVIMFNGQEGRPAAPITWGPDVLNRDQPRSFTWSWSGTMPASGSSVTITAQGTADTEADSGEDQELVSAPSINVLAFLTPPNLEVTSPIPSSPGGNVQIIASDKNGVTVNISGTASGATGSPFSPETIAWNATWTASGMVNSSDGFAHWNTTIQVPLGVYTITFTCTDSGGNTQSRTLNFEVALPADIFTTEPEDYLRALLEFATQPAIKTNEAPPVARIRIAGRDATTADLQQVFGQPFADLALNTPIVSYQRKANEQVHSKANEQVHKIRLVVEVLRNLLRTYPPSSAQTLASAEQAYLQAAYTTLLTRIGTSYNEVRLARAYNDAARQALADRLDITVDHLPALLLDPNAPPTSPMAMSEAVLEQLFGLEDTSRDPLADGSVLHDDKKQVVRWTLDGIEWNYNTDPDGCCYLMFKKQSNGSIQANVYRDAARNFLIASGTTPSGWTNPVRVPLSPQRNSGISANSNIVINYTADIQQPVGLSAIPRLLSWQMARTQSRWTQEDFPPALVQVSADHAQAGQQNVSVSITGRFTHFVQGKTTVDFGMGIGVASLTIASATMATAVLNVDPAAAAGLRDITVRTGTEVARLTKGFRVLVITAGQPVLTDLNPNAGQPGQQNLSVTLTGQSTHFVQGTTTADFGPGITVASLTVTSPTSATAVVNVDPGAAVGGRDVTLTTNTEVVTLARGFAVTAAIAIIAPLIDPDLLFDADFKHRLSSDSAYALFQQRRQLLQTWYKNLTTPSGPTTTPKQHFDAILQQVLARTSTDLSALDDQRSRGIDISWPLANINVSVAGFNYLVRVAALVAALQPGEDLLASEWEDVYNILVQVQKIGAFESWRMEEQSAGLTLGPDWLQISNDTTTAPPQASTWRAASTDRVRWRNRLRGRVNQRQALVQGLQAAADATEVATLPILRDGPDGTGGLMSAVTISLPVPGLHSTGIAATGPGLPGATDRHWTIIRNPSDIKPAFITHPNSSWLANSTNSQWIAPQPDESAAADPHDTYTYRTMVDLSGFDSGSAEIDLNVAVARQVTDIQANGVSLGVPPATGSQAFTAIKLKSGLSSGLNLLDFVMKNFVMQNDPPAASGLRVEFASSSIKVSPDGTRFSEWFLIDMDCASYQVTTRLNQAIESLQALFFSLRNGKFQELPALESWQLVDPAYDAEWTWMGSYANWVAAMGVFLYPENLLLPLLRLPMPQMPPPPSGQTPPPPPFETLVDNLAKKGQVSPEDARGEVATYWITLCKLNPSVVSPNTLPNPPLSDQLTDKQLAFLGAFEESLFKAPLGRDPLGAYYLREAFFTVPIYVASQLQQAGQFTAALDWYRIVYAYYLPEEKRKIYYGLTVEEDIATQYAQAPQWLDSSLNTLNPYDIAVKRANAYTRFTLISLIRLMLDFADTEFARDAVESLPRARTLYLTVLDLLDRPELLQPPPISAVPPNPVVIGLRQHAEIQLVKMRSARDIAGLVRVQGSQQPTVYRYTTLIDRAKQLVALAQQMESSFLAALEKFDAEKYAALRAQQDLESAGATVTLQNLKVQEAADSVTLAADQIKRASDQVDHWRNLISSDIISQEAESIDWQKRAGELQVAAAAVYAVAALQSGFGSSFFSGQTEQLVAQGLTTAASASQTEASILTASASLEEKKIDWQDQLTQAQDDQVIANQQFTIAQDQHQIASQEQMIADMQQRHAQAVVDFLITQKFTGAALYEWMSGILQRVYSYFLQQASAVAKMAQSQLAFERQVNNLNFIQADYWQAPSDGGAGGGSSQSNDKKGLTGSARLLQDVTRLDEYAFQTDQRKLQLTKMISLAQLDPFAFQQFRQTGVLRFATPMDLYDHDFPGHYLRLIRQLKLLVAALIPPTQGIKATLTNPGVSRAVVEDDILGFQMVSVTRQPQAVALTSPANSSGQFVDLADTQSGMLLPFENLGVDTVWEFTMPRAANPIDYSTIADVLLTIDYTALDSADYRAQVVRQLDSTVSADRAYSFQQQFPDSWYELNNPDPSATHTSVSFQTMIGDFPPNVQNLSIDQILLYFVPGDGAAFPIQPTLTLTPPGDGTEASVGGTVSSPPDGNPLGTVFSTRRGNASAWMPMIGMSPAGSWTLDVPNMSNGQNVFQTEQVKDILFVITYNGNTPAWPS